MCCKRLAPMRFVPFSYFCTCWNVSPSPSPSFCWLIPSTNRLFSDSCLLHVSSEILIRGPIRGGALYDRAHEVEPDVGQCPLARGCGRNRFGGHVPRAGGGADAIVRATKLGTLFALNR